MRSVRALPALVLALILSFGLVAMHQPGLSAQSQPAGPQAPSLNQLREWLTYLSSDALEGRATFSEGLGLAAAYIADQLKDAGVKPGGDGDSFFQRVPVLGVRTTSHSTVTVEVNGHTRTFADGEGVTFPRNVGGKQTLKLNEVEFVGYGLNLSDAHNDYSGRDVKGKAVIWLGARGPLATDSQQVSRLLNARASIAVDEMGAAAGIGPVRAGAGGGGGRGGNTPDFTTTQKLDSPRTPSVTANDEFLEFLFSASDLKYAELKALSEQREPLPRFALSGVTLTFNVNADYTVVTTQYTRNVVGIVEGIDPLLRDSYVAFGAHYDHVGYMPGQMSDDADRISNGADDDGSGTATLIGLARSFAAGPKTKRSLVFVWHAGEELGLYGSEYFADYGRIPTEKIAAQLNMDMIGRNRDNLESESNTVYTVGSDRISTELHNIMIDVNAAMARPLTLDYELNDPTDPERIYYRSDHYSYAAKGVPVIFFCTGLHPDYHRVTDTVEKINFEKMARIGQLVSDIGRRIANQDRSPQRDFRGARLGKGGSGRLSTN